MRLGSHSGYYLARNRSQHFHWQADYQFTRRFSDLFWPFPRLVIQFVTLPLVAEKSYLLAPPLVMSLGLCLEIYSQSSIPRQPGNLTFVFRLKLWLSWISGNLMWQVLTAFLFALSGTSLQRLSILMLLAQLATVSSSSRGRYSIKTGQILRKLRVLHSESC